MQRTDDLRIREIKELVPPAHVLREFPLTDKAAEVTRVEDDQTAAMAGTEHAERLIEEEA